jgi:hypothetical protein
VEQELRFLGFNSSPDNTANILEEIKIFIENIKLI